MKQADNLKSRIQKVLLLFKSCFSDDEKKRYYYAGYTIVFGIVALICFSWFLFSGRTLIWEDDGWNQHLEALVYYSEYLRAFFWHLFVDHQFVFPEWDFYIGEGADILNTFHYYVIGDPIAFFSVLVPKEYMHYFYSFTCVLRLYLAGISFSALCLEIGNKNRYAILTGSITYCFCKWGLYNAARHLFFLNPMIYFPLMILGMELIIRKKKPYLFIIMTAISAASNFYFFYMIVWNCLIYGTIRLIILYRKQFKEFILTFLRIALMAFIGVCLGAIILLPVIMMILQDSRMTSAMQPFHLFYPVSYYSQLPSMFITNSSVYWLCLDYSAPVIIGIFLLFTQKKKNLLLKIFFLLGIVIMIFPIGGRFFNGMSYMTNRWVWAYSLLSAYILVTEWDELIHLSTKKWCILSAICTGYYVLCLVLDKSRSANTFSSIALMLILLIIIRAGVISHQKILLLFAVMGAFVSSFWMFAPTTSNYISEFKENGRVKEEWAETEAAWIKNLSDGSYSRISGLNLSPNANIKNHISSTQYYWTLSNSNTAQYRTDMEMFEPRLHDFTGYDGRTALTTLASVEYYAVKRNVNTENIKNEIVFKEEDIKTIPFGFSFVDTINTSFSLDGKMNELKKELGTDELSEEQKNMMKLSQGSFYSVYKNDYPLPILYCYDNYCTKETWEGYNPVQKQEMQLEAAYVDDANPEGIGKFEKLLPDYIIEYEESINDMEINHTEDGFVTTAGNKKVELIFQGNPNSETYVEFEGLEFIPSTEYSLYFGNDDVDPLNLYNKTNWDMLPKKTKTQIRLNKLYWNPIQNANIGIMSSSWSYKTLPYAQPDATFSSGRHDYIANLGYTSEPINKITITLPSRGIYKFKNLRVYCVPMDEYPAKIAALQENTPGDIQIETDIVRATVSADRNKILCLATPFSNGWSVTVDGKEAEILRVNERYTGVVVPAGTHKVEFLYRMPYRKEAVIVFIIGLAALAGVISFTELKRRRKN